MATRVVLFGTDTDYNHGVTTDFVDITPYILLNEGITAPPAREGEESRFIEFSLQFKPASGEDTDDVLAIPRSIHAMLERAKMAYVDRDYQEPIKLGIQLNDASTMVNFILKDGYLEQTYVIPNKDYYWYNAEFEAEPAGYGALQTFTESSTLTNGSGFEFECSAIKGDLPGLAVLKFIDKSTGDEKVNDVRLGQMPRLTAMSDFQGVVDASANFHSSTVSESNTIGGSYERVVASTAWKSLAFVERPSSKPALSGKFDVYARMRDSTVILNKPTGLIATEMNDYIPAQQVTVRYSSGTNKSTAWSTTTRNGANLYLVITLKGPLSRISSVPASWSLVTNNGHGSNTVSVAIYKIENAASRSGTETITLTTSTDCTISLIELPYMSFGTSLVDQFKGANGTGTAVSTGASTAIAQAHDYVLTVAASSSLGTLGVFSNSGTATYQNGTERYDTAGTTIDTGNTSVTGTLNMNATYGASQDWVMILVAIKMRDTALPTDLSSSYNYIVVPVSAAGNEGGASAITPLTIGGSSPQYVLLDWTTGGGTVNKYRIYWDKGSGYRYLETVDNKTWYLHFTEVGATVQEPPVEQPLYSQLRVVLTPNTSGGTFGEIYNITTGDSLWHLMYIGTYTLGPIPAGMDNDYNDWAIHVQVKQSSGASPNIDCDAFYFFPSRHPQLYMKHPSSVNGTQFEFFSETRYDGRVYAIERDKSTQAQMGQIEVTDPFFVGPGNTKIFGHIGVINLESDVTDAKGTLTLYVRPLYKWLAGAA